MKTLENLALQGEYSLLRDRISKGALAERLYSGQCYDTSLPQSWVDNCYQRGFDDSASHFVWGYDKGDIVGSPWPLTVEGVRILSIIARSN